VSPESSNAAFNVISGPLQGIQNSSKDHSMLQTVQNKALPGLEDLHFLHQGLPKDVLVKKAAGTSGKAFFKEETRSEMKREKKGEEELHVYFVAER